MRTQHATFVATMNRYFTDAGASGDLKFRGVEVEEKSEPTRGLMVDISTDYFRIGRSFIQSDNRIEPWNEAQTNTQFAETRSGGQRHATWVDVIVETVGINSLLDENALVANFAKSLRWGIISTLVWIATRDMALAAKASLLGTSFQRENIGLAVRKGMETQRGRSINWPYKNLNDAWNYEVALRIGEGSLKAFATLVTNSWDGGNSSHAPGVVFPPSDMPGLAYECFIDDGNQGPVLKPSGSIGANKWNEWHSMTFSQTDVMELWPPIQNSSPLPMSESTPLVKRNNYVPPAKLMAWFETRKNTWPRSEPPPTEEDDIIAAKLAFVGVGRQQVRDTRRDVYPPEWLKPGPRNPEW